VGPPRRAPAVAVAAAALGLVFAGYSTYDYALQLDRQVHAVHCSFIPGAPLPGEADNACKTALFSAYSALFRATWWGGVPVSLFALGAFAFFVGFGLYLALGARGQRAHAFYAAASLTPVAASFVMFLISVVHLHVFCKLCVGIYVASFVLGGAAIVGWRTRRREPAAPSATGGGPPGEALGPESWGWVLLWLSGLGMATLAPAVAYVSALPDYRARIDRCGKLTLVGEPHNGLLKIATAHPMRPVLLFEDPLCPTCKVFHERMVDEGIFERLDVTMAMFPLDTECNWMLDRALHPGACVVAKAVLCGGNDRARSILEWAYDNQEELRDAGKRGADALTAKIAARWGAEIGACVGRPQTAMRLNQHLHFAANNHIPVSTPQMFVGDTRICDEDTDLGLKYTLAQLAPEVLP
jgi:Vitamin K epoxide reductase family